MNGFAVANNSEHQYSRRREHYREISAVNLRTGTDFVKSMCSRRMEKFNESIWREKGVLLGRWPVKREKGYFTDGVAAGDGSREHSLHQSADNKSPEKKDGKGLPSGQYSLKWAKAD
jgi:hypothetical protein